MAKKPWGTRDDFATSIQQTADGGYIVVGVGDSKDGDNTGNDAGGIWVVKLNSTGNIEWQKMVGSGSSGVAVQQTTDGGYIVAGYSYYYDGELTGNHGGFDYFVLKLTSTGNIEWQKSFGGSDTDDVYAIQQTTDGGYIVAGYSYSNDGDVTGNHGGLGDAWIVKLNSTGNIEWQKCLGGSSGDAAYAIQQTNDGGYIVAGESGSTDGDLSGVHGGSGYWVVKLNSTGNIEWQKSLGGSKGGTANSIKQTADGGYIVAGWSYSNDGDVTGNHGLADCWIVKLNSTGNLEWQKSLGGSSEDRAHAIYQTTDGGYIFAGLSWSNDGDVTGNHGDLDCWIVKLNSTGNLEWQKSLGGSDNDGADFNNTIQQTKDGGYIVGAYSYSNDGDVSGNHGSVDFWIVKLGASVLPLHLLSFDAVKNKTNVQLNWQTTNEINTSHFIVQQSSNGTFFNNIGRVEAKNTSGNNDYSLTDASPGDGVNFYRLQMVDIDGKITYSSIIKVAFAGKNALQVFPNPTKNTITVSGLENKGTIKIISVDGKVAKQLSAKAGNMLVDISTLTKGIYILQYNNEAKTEQVKIIKQ